MIHFPRTKRLLAVSLRAIALTVVVIGVLSAVSAQSLPGYKAPDKPKTPEMPVAMKVASGQAPLAKLYGHLKPDASRIKRLSPLDARIKQKWERKSEKRLNIGVVRVLPSELNPLTDGTMYSVAEGDVRVAAVNSPGALYTRIHFKGFSLPAGARVFVYSAAKPDLYFGPYEGRGPWGDGMFWTAPVRGDQVVIEYRSPAGERLTDAPFKVNQVSHIYKDIFSVNDPAGACNLEVLAEWAEVAKSVGLLDFITGGGEALCTGTLLSDTNPNAEHHVLTANHCISTQAEAQTLVVYWNYNTGDSHEGGGLPITSGSNLLVTGQSSDFTLLRLTGSLPGGLFFAGWDAGAVSSGTSITGIHHPNGSHKRISFGATNSNCDPGLPGPCANFMGVTWGQGTTEVGSSGSGLWTGTPANAKLVGQLSGGFASCANQSADDFYGRFSVTYPGIASFLEGTNCVTSLSPTSQAFGAGAGSSSFTVNAPGGCNWTAVSTDTTWLTVTAPPNGAGNGTVNFQVAANSSSQRSASIVVGGQVFVVTQAGGGPCAATPITIGQTINGQLTTGDCPLGDGTFYDVYSFSGTAGQQVAVLMQSSEFDTYLFLNRPDGSNLTQDDDGGGGTNSRIPSAGFITLPTTGTYTIWANAFDPGDTTGGYSLTLTGTAPPTPRTLTVASQNPNSGVNITVSPTDNNGNGNGTTQFTRTYSNNATVNLTAPTTAGGNVFLKWQRDGVDLTTNPATSVLMNADHTMTAVYGPPPTRTLILASLNPNSGVAITVSPNDNSGQGNGTTQFTRTYNQNTTVTLTAAGTTPEGNPFKRWLKDGSHFNGLLNAIVDMTSDTTMTAEYYIKPKIYGEENNPNAAAALNSVTFLRGPFQILDAHNFATDGHTRIIIFTNDLGLTNPPLNDAAVLRVEASGIGLPIEAYGPLTGTPGLTGSYIAVKLPDGLPTGTPLQLVVWLFGVSSDPKTLTIAP